MTQLQSCLLQSILHKSQAPITRATTKSAKTRRICGTPCAGRRHEYESCPWEHDSPQQISHSVDRIIHVIIIITSSYYQHGCRERGYVYKVHTCTCSTSISFIDSPKLDTASFFGSKVKDLVVLPTSACLLIKMVDKAVVLVWLAFLRLSKT